VSTLQCLLGQFWGLLSDVAEDFVSLGQHATSISNLTPTLRGAVMPIGPSRIALYAVDLWRWGHYYASKTRHRVTRWWSVISQQEGILGCLADAVRMYIRIKLNLLFCSGLALWSKVSLEKLIVAQPDKWFFSFCGTQNVHYVCHRTQPPLATLLITSTHFTLPN